MMRRLIPFLAVVAALLLPVRTSVSGQARPAEMQRYGFIAESDDADALWVNPGALGLRPGSGMVGDYVFDGRLGRSGFRQLVTGLRIGGVAFGYRHDEFPDERQVRAQGDEYRVGLAAGNPTFSLGGAYQWHRVGPRASAWDVGAVARPVRWLSVAAAWREIGSPEIGGIRIDDRLAGGVSVRPFRELATLSWEGEFGRASGDFLGHKIGVRTRHPGGIEAFGHLEMNRGAADRLGVGVRVFGRQSALHLVSRTGGDLPGRLALGTVSYNPPMRNSMQTSRRIASLSVGGSYADFPPEGFALSSEPALQPLLAAIAQARRDPEVRGLLLRVRPLAGSFIGPVRAGHEELRREILAFREAGKPVVAFIDGHVSEAELFVASAADEVVLPRLALIVVTGVHFELQRLRRTFEKFGIEWDATTAGDYKSTFHTQYTDSSTSAQAAWIDGLVGRAYRETVEGIAAGRNLAADRVEALIDSPPITAAAAVEAGYADRLGDYETAEERIKALAGDHEIRRLREQAYRTERWGIPPAIVVINAHGAIVPGRGSRNPITGSTTMGSETVARQIRDAARVRGARAIVLRVNSPGGSAVASDEILSAIRWVQTEKELPVIASMGDIAASGGYWISMAADTIVAERLTVTGSIGVVASIPVVEQLLDTLRVNTERWQRGRYAGALSLTRHRTPEEMELLERSMEHIYDVFVDEVASGRELPVDSVRSLAGGRVWFGADALPAGLVDEFGGLRDAIRIAAARAGIAGDFRVLRMRRPGSALLTRVFRYIGVDEALGAGALLPQGCTACLLMDDRLAW
jgi:protease IV